jgi:hypothetical protein
MRAWPRVEAARVAEFDIQPRLRVFIAATLLLAVLQTWAGAQSSTAEVQDVPWLAIALGGVWLGAAFLLSVKQPRVMVGAMAFFTFFTAWRPIDLPIGSLQVSQLLAITILAALGVRWLALREPAPIRSALAPALLLLVAVVALAAVHTFFIDVRTTEGLAIMRQGRASPFIRSITAVAALLTGMSAFVVVIRVLKTTESVMAAINCWAAGALFSIFVGAYQMLQYYVPALPRAPLAAALGGSDGTGIAGRDVASLTEAGDLMIRMTSFATEARHLAYLLMPLVCFQLVYIFLSRGAIRRAHRRGWWTTGVVLVGFALTASRSAYVLALIAAGIVLWSARRHGRSSGSRLFRKSMQLAAGAAVMLLVWAVISGLNPIGFLQLQLASLLELDKPGSGVPYAIDGLLLAWRMFQSSPVFGAGWGSYVYAVEKYPLEFARQANPNNLYLLMLGETGVIGLCAMLWVFWRGLRVTSRKLPAQGRRHRPLLLGLGAALLGTYVTFMFWDNIFITNLWMLLGFAEAARRAARRDLPAVETQPTAQLITCSGVTPP